MTKLNDLEREDRWHLEWLANGFGWLASPLVFEGRGKYRANHRLKYTSVECEFCGSAWESSDPAMLQYELRCLGWVYTSRPGDGHRRVRYGPTVHIWACPRCIRHTLNGHAV